MKTNSLRGFSPLEILVVFAIIALLITVLVSSPDFVHTRGHGAAEMFVRNSVGGPLLDYRRDVGRFPSTPEGLQVLLTAPAAHAATWRGPYLEEANGRLPLDPWGEPYEYRQPGTKNPSGYDVFSKGPDKHPDTPDDIGNW